MRRRKMRQWVERLNELRAQQGLKRGDPFVKLGYDEQKAGRVYGLVEIWVPVKEGPPLEFGLRWP